jgi:predicted nucleic acid-binding Zn ribbon protein
MSSSKTIKSVMKELIKDPVLRDKVHQEQLKVKWTEIVGDQIANISRILKFEKGRLTIKTSSSIWLYELSLRKKEIIDQINEKLESKIVNELIIR